MSELETSLDHIYFSSRKPHREDNECELNGNLDGRGGLSIVMMSDSGHVVLNEADEKQLLDFLSARAQARAKFKSE